MLALLLSAAALGSATRTVAQVTPVSPFNGVYTETFSDFPNYSVGFLPERTALLGGLATVTSSGQDLLIYEPGVADLSLGTSGTAQTGGGSKGMAVTSLADLATLNFARGITAFGGYWGADTQSNPLSPTPATISVTFYDTAGNLLDTQSFGYDHTGAPYNGDGVPDWHGWQSATPIGSIAYQGDYVTLSAVQVDTTTAAPESSTLLTTLLLTMTGSLLYHWRIRRANSEKGT